MTNKFTTPCFVRVENPEERDKLLAWCASIGYIHVPNGPGEWNVPVEDCLYIVCSNQTLASNTFGVCSGHLCKPTISEDCRTNIELFKALAAMNDENASEQWFVNDHGVWRKAANEALDLIGYTKDQQDVKHFFRKATAEELINHFKY